jgi:hypothetical protein
MLLPALLISDSSQPPDDAETGVSHSASDQHHCSVLRTLRSAANRHPRRVFPSKRVDDSTPVVRTTRARDDAKQDRGKRQGVSLTAAVL